MLTAIMRMAWSFTRSTSENGMNVMARTFKQNLTNCNGLLYFRHRERRFRLSNNQLGDNVRQGSSETDTMRARPS